MKTIKFYNQGGSPEIKNKQKLKGFLRSIFADEKVDFERLSYIFCKDEFLLELNRKYLNHDTYTDIITFTLSDKSAPLTAEIYISIERVLENSKSLKIDFQEELYRVMIHGIIHLCGFSDHSSKEKEIMREKENFYLSQYRFT
ncbi:rRNA maturation RNase YbeY [Ginsengibacter hankyongi]|uniref:Endoribonuclease YbeY n=1 Tax=Ginsengibacter hankyongi TaxID=2607284 RepID=A0A5J5ILX8_9BACT|nr:rRNA maturation RNase YbeY [Ginsengibacter hankyongi]KAA9041979.1 rRNA maturation RNase YbeY [Ginsengibacter hankyongi]